MYQSLVSLPWIKSNISYNFSIAYRTELQRILIIFLDTIKPIHQASIVHTMSDPEHMPNLMYHRPHRWIQNHLPVYLWSLLAGVGVIPA